MESSYFEYYNYNGMIGVFYWPPAGKEYPSFSHRVFDWGDFNK
jgi:hypothetical protein